MPGIAHRLRDGDPADPARFEQADHLGERAARAEAHGRAWLDEIAEQPGRRRVPTARRATRSWSLNTAATTTSTEVREPRPEARLGVTVAGLRRDDPDLHDVAFAGLLEVPRDLRS